MESLAAHQGSFHLGRSEMPERFLMWTPRRPGMPVRTQKAGLAGSGYARFVATLRPRLPQLCAKFHAQAGALGPGGHLSEDSSSANIYDAADMAAVPGHCVHAKTHSLLSLRPCPQWLALSRPPASPPAARLPGSSSPPRLRGSPPQPLGV